MGNSLNRDSSETCGACASPRELHNNLMLISVSQGNTQWVRYFAWSRFIECNKTHVCGRSSATSHFPIKVGSSLSTLFLRLWLTGWFYFPWLCESYSEGIHYMVWVETIPKPTSNPCSGTQKHKRKEILIHGKRTFYFINLY